MTVKQSTTLFLDRDGVINKRLPGDYVKSRDEFEFMPGVLEALAIFNIIFRYIFLVTNQQGIGKGLMKISDLNDIHDHMMKEIIHASGRIDKIYYCPDLAHAGSIYRKPGIGMALQAKKDFPQVRFRDSVMVGDSVNDMLFGYKAGMQTVLLSEDEHLARLHYKIVNYLYPDLLSFAKSLITI